MSDTYGIFRYDLYSAKSNSISCYFYMRSTFCTAAMLGHLLGVRQFVSCQQAFNYVGNFKFYTYPYLWVRQHLSGESSWKGKVRFGW